MEKVCEMGYWNDSSWCWKFHIDADTLLEDPVATEETFTLIELLTNTSPTIDAKDTLRWWQNQEGCFSVKSYYNLLRDQDLEEVMETESKLTLKRIWKINIPSRLKVFGWRAVLNKLPTKDQSVKREIILNEQQHLCLFC